MGPNPTQVPKRCPDLVYRSLAKLPGVARVDLSCDLMPAMPMAWPWHGQGKGKAKPKPKAAKA